VKTYAWNEEKNQRLKAERGVSFEEIIVHIATGDLLDIVEHPHPEKYKGRRGWFKDRQRLVDTFHTGRIL